MSARRMGSREYSLERARRTIFWIIAFVEDAPWSSSDISASGDELARGLWRVEASAPESSGSTWSGWGLVNERLRGYGLGCSLLLFASELKAWCFQCWCWC